MVSSAAVNILVHICSRCARVFLGLFEFIPKSRIVETQVYEYSALEDNVKLFF